MTKIIPDGVQNLVGLRDWIESSQAPVMTESNELSMAALTSVREMQQPCANTTEEGAISPVGAMLGGSEQRFGQDYVMVRCRFAQEYQDPNMPDVVCKLTSQRCISDLPRGRKTGVSISVIG